MREVRIERRSPFASPWALLVGSLVLAGIVWWFASGSPGTDVTDSGQGRSLEVLGEQREAPRVTGEEHPLGTVLTDLDANHGAVTSGELTVDRVVSGRGFFASGDGGRVFVLLDDSVGEAPRLTPGDRVRVHGDVRNAGTIVDEQYASDEDHQAVSVLRSFLHADDLQVVSDVSLY